MRNRYLQYGSYIFVCLCLILSACGGGGDSPLSNRPASSPASISTNVPRSGEVYISEISAGDADGSGMWVELYNNSAADVSLNGFSVRFSGFNDQRMQYDLPRGLQLKAGGYLLLAGKRDFTQPNTDQIAYLDYFSNASLLGSNGVFELLKEGVTQDFVRFGSSEAIPQSVGIGPGNNIVVKPSYGQSLARQAGQWVLVSFATPGGINDVLATATDADNDGIPDSAEIPGGTFAGIDYYAMGARGNRPDIFVQMDYMKSADPGINPRKEALQKVVDAFKARGIALHVDVGNLFSPAFNPEQFNLGGGRLSRNNQVEYQPCVGMEASALCSSFYAYKNTNMDIRRKQVFHYLLMANSMLENGRIGPSGYAEILGNDIIVSLGGWGLNSQSDAAKNQLINYQASTIMHELGHNLGLDHGGDEETNYKPNYYSVMNYLYQLKGLGDGSAYSALERYYSFKNTSDYSLNNLCQISAGPCSHQFLIDYSNGSGAELDENRLYERDLIGRGSVTGLFADWNRDSKADIFNYALDINGDNIRQVLRDHNDWQKIMLVFARHPSGNEGASMLRSANTMLNPMLDDRQRWSQEAAPSPAFLAAVRRVH